jgi:hypothetical protein
MGVANIALLAPTWLQLLHLIGADVCWMMLVLLIAHQFAFREQSNILTLRKEETGLPREKKTSNR